MDRQSKRDVDYYMDLNYQILLDQFADYDGTKMFSAVIPDLPGCGASGDTLEEALDNLQDSKYVWFATSLEKGIEIPEPINEQDFSGKFVLRIEPKLHARLTKKARMDGKSLNDLIKTILTEFIAEEKTLNSLKKLMAKLLEETSEKANVIIREANEKLELANKKLKEANSIVNEVKIVRGRGYMENISREYFNNDHTLTQQSYEENSNNQSSLEDCVLASFQQGREGFTQA